LYFFWITDANFFLFFFSCCVFFLLSLNVLCCSGGQPPPQFCTKFQENSRYDHQQRGVVVEEEKRTAIGKSAGQESADWGEAACFEKSAVLRDPKPKQNKKTRGNAEISKSSKPTKFRHIEKQSIGHGTGSRIAKEVVRATHQIGDECDLRNAPFFSSREVV